MNAIFFHLIVEITCDDQGFLSIFEYGLKVFFQCIKIVLRVADELAVLVFAIAQMKTDDCCDASVIKVKISCCERAGELGIDLIRLISPHRGDAFHSHFA